MTESALGLAWRLAPEHWAGRGLAFLRDRANPWHARVAEYLGNDLRDRQGGPWPCSLTADSHSSWPAHYWWRRVGAALHPQSFHELCLPSSPLLFSSTFSSWTPIRPYSLSSALIKEITDKDWQWCYCRGEEKGPVCIKKRLCCMQKSHWPWVVKPCLWGTIQCGCVFMNVWIFGVKWWTMSQRKITSSFILE